MSQPQKQSDLSKLQPPLSPPLARLRKKWLNAVKELAPNVALIALRERLAQETDGAVRLANLAAQSWIIRQRLIGLQSDLHDQPAPPEDVEVASDGPVETKPDAPTPEVQAEVSKNSAAPEWIKVRILSETEVKGMRFFEGSIIEVRSDDAHKLIEAKSAELVPVDSTPRAQRASKSKAKSASKK